MQWVKLGASFGPQHNRQLAPDLSARSVRKGSHSKGASNRKGSSSKPLKGSEALPTQA